MSDYQDLIKILHAGDALILCSHSTFNELFERFGGAQSPFMDKTHDSYIRTIWMAGFTPGNEQSNMRALAKSLKEAAEEIN